MKPACQVFLNKATEEQARSLIKTLSAAVNKHKKPGFKAFVFFIDGDAKKIQALNKELKADNIAIGTLDSKHEGVELYKLNLQAKSTVILYEDRIVTAKFVDYNPKKQAKELNKQIEKICK